MLNSAVTLPRLHDSLRLGIGNFLVLTILANALIWLASGSTVLLTT